MEDSFDFGKLMRKHQKQHKMKPAEFISAASAVNKRRNSNLKYRKSLRNTVLDNNRKLSCESPIPVKNTLSKCEHRKQQLEKWKEQKEREKREAATKKKKPFIVGVPNVSQKYVPPPPIKPLPSTTGRVTRSQSSKMNKPVENKEVKQSTKSFAPRNATFNAPQIKNAPKLPKLAEVKKKDKKQNINLTFNPVVPKEEKKIRLTRSKVISTTNVQNPVHKQTENTKAAEVIHKDPKTPVKPVPKSESSSEEKLRSPKQDDNVIKTPEQIVEEAVKNSPYVIMSRGKANATKELKTKLNEALFDDDEDEELDNVEYFRQQLSSEIKRLTDMCDTWTAISKQIVLPESAQEAVLSAVGQARLLMSQKFGQFSSLVDRCADPQPHQPLVTVADLQGFWDMMFMQVDNVNMRFKKLEELQSRGWEEEKPLQVQKRVARGNAKRVARPTAGPSRLREMIAAARKAKKELESPAKLVTTSDGDNKTFEAGFFSVCSPIRSPTVRSPSYHGSANNSMLKAVLSNEAKKSARKSNSSFAILRASVMAKNMEVEGIAPIPQTPLTPINLNATPSRSILKAPNTNQKSTGKSVKMVLFNKSDDEDENSLQTSENCHQNLENGHQTSENCHQISENCYQTCENCHQTTEKCHQTSENSHQILEHEVEENKGLPISGITDHDENKENKTSSRRKSKLVRQDAEYRSPILTRSRRKSAVIDKSPSDIKHGETTENVDVTPSTRGVTPRRSSRRLLQEAGEVSEEKEKPRKRRSSKMKSSPQAS